MISRVKVFSNILAFLFVCILSLPANAKGLEEFSEELDFSSTKVFFETLSQALSNEALPQKLSETEVSAAVMIFKKIEMLKKNAEVPLEIGPHPDLSDTQLRAIEMDYCMIAGREDIVVRKALLFYALKRLGLDADPAARRPQDQQIVLSPINSQKTDIYNKETSWQ